MNVHELGGDRRVLEVHRPDGGDAAPWRQRLLARDAERGAVRQAQPAADAGGQFLVVEMQFHADPP